MNKEKLIKKEQPLTPYEQLEKFLENDPPDSAKKTWLKMRADIDYQFALITSLNDIGHAKKSKNIETEIGNKINLLLEIKNIYEKYLVNNGAQNELLVTQKIYNNLLSKYTIKIKNDQGNLEKNPIRLITVSTFLRDLNTINEAKKK